MTPAEQTAGVIFLLAVMAVPRLAQSRRALLVVLTVGVVVVLALWFGGVERLPQGLGNVGQAIGVALVATAFAMGVLVRGMVLFGRKRGWPSAADAGVSLGAVVLAGLGLMGLFDML